MKTKSNSKTENKTDSGLLNRTAQLAERPRIDLTLRDRNRALPVESLLDLIRKDAPHFWDVVEVVGNWVWVELDGKQPFHVTIVLSQLGFFWNYRRQVWQHPCGQPVQRTEFDPRRKYRAYFPAAQKSA